MFCPRCGTKFDDGATSCPSCGTPLPERATPHDAEPASVPDKDVAAAPVSYADERHAVDAPTMPMLGKSVRSIIYFIITLLLFVLLAHLLGITG